MKNTFDNVYIIGYHSFFREETSEMIFSSENEWIDNFYARKEVYDIYKVK